jgi:hypothetical protein
MSTYVLLACGFGAGFAIALWGIFDALKHSRRQEQEPYDRAHSAGDKARH